MRGLVQAEQNRKDSTRASTVQPSKDRSVCCIYTAGRRVGRDRPYIYVLLAPHDEAAMGTW